MKEGKVMEIPMAIQQQIRKNEKQRKIDLQENVLLLSMSTLYREPDVNTYHIKEDDKNWYFKGISQLEAHTKYVISKLKSMDKQLHRIVILESKETFTEKPEKWYGETAVSFYKKRINEFIGVERGLLIECATLLEKEDEHKDLKETSVKYNKEILFCDIDISVDTYFWEAVESIRSKRDHEVNLYIDMQGGDRNTIAEMNAIVELLKEQNVNICGRYANDFAPGKKLHTIREVSKEYRTYDLITAMDVFKKYGWGKELVEYFKNEESTSRNKRLVDAIQKASAAISLCDVDRFDDAIQTIASLESEFTTNSQTRTQLDVVYEDIRRDYKPLINAEYRYIAQIEWCLEKNFIQQAITIFEAKMPYEYVNSGLIYYMTKEELKTKKDEFYNDCLNEYNTLGNTKFKMLDLNHYIVKTDLRGKKLDKYKRIGMTNKRDRQKVIQSIIKYKDICNKRNSVNHVGSSKMSANGVAQHLKSNDPNNQCWKTVELDNITQEIRGFLYDWKKIADRVPKNVKEKVVDLS